MTSSPALTPAAISPRCKPVVALLTATACFAPTYFATRFSNSSVRLPWAEPVCSFFFSSAVMPSRLSEPTIR